MKGTRHGSATTRDSLTWVTADGVHADEGGQVSWDRLEDYLAAMA